MMWPNCENPEKCQHWQDWKSQKDTEYDWCHLCVMDLYCFKPIEPPKEET